MESQNDQPRQLMNMNAGKIDEAVERVFDLFRAHGKREYLGESVSQVEHMVQCAMLAEAEGQSAEVVLAALFHDIGHLLAYEDARLARMASVTQSPTKTTSPSRVLGVQSHEQHGARYLEGLGFPKTLSAVVEAHVEAKRYLVYADPDYHNQLSDASKQTLRCQGGPMTADEAQRFESEGHFQAAIRLRHWDDKAKVAGVVCKPLERYEEMCRTYLRDVVCN